MRASIPDEKEKPLTTREPITPDAAWLQLFRIAAVFCVVVAALIPIQAFLFISFPPPRDVAALLALFAKQPFLGLIDLDLLLSVDNLFVAVIYLGLYAALRKANRSLMSIALAAGLIGTVLYLVSREATFSMLALSKQFEAASTAEQKTILLAAAQTVLTIYNGGCFDVSYVLGGVTVLLVSWVTLRSAVFGRAVAILGIITGILMLLPPTTGPIGLVVSLVSLLPTMVWLVLLAVGFLRLSSSTSRETREPDLPRATDRYS
jgi:Domain of unknown function (DUF4386)